VLPGIWSGIHTKAAEAQHNKVERNSTFKIGEQVFLPMPALKTGPCCKLALPFKVPYLILTLHPNGAEVIIPVGTSRASSLRVTLN